MIMTEMTTLMGPITINKPIKTIIQIGKKQQRGYKKHKKNKNKMKLQTHDENHHKN